MDENGKLLKDWKKEAFEETLEKSRNESLDELETKRDLYSTMCGPIFNSKLFNKMLIDSREGTIEALNHLIQKKTG